MSQVIIADSVEAGDTTDDVLFTMPASYSGFIGSLIATNTTGGGLTITIKIGNRNGSTYTILSVDPISANTAQSYNKGTTQCITPITLNAGETLIGNGSGAGIIITFGGLRFST